MSEEASRLAFRSPDRSGPLELSETEAHILRLFDSLQALQYQLALARTRKGYQQDGPQGEDGEPLRQVQSRLLEKRTSYALRNHVVDSAIVADPLLQAVHHGSQASPIERDLLPFIQQRDGLAGDIAKQTRDLEDLVRLLSQVEVEHVRGYRRSTELAAEVGQLAEEARKVEGTDSVEGSQLRGELLKLGAELGLNKRLWTMAKETVSGIITGSGVDWVADLHLQDMVLNAN